VAGEDGWWQRGRATKAAVKGVDFSYFLINEFWIMGVVGGGQRRNAISKKKIQPGKRTYVGNWYYYIWQRKLLRPPNMAL
jgi:hypothetical protein